MIHDDLVRLFDDAPPPSLSQEFSMTLRRRLRGVTPSRDRYTARLTWGVRLYWAIAAVLLQHFWQPVALTPVQLAVVALVAAAMVLALRRATQPGPLARVLRQLWQ